MTFNYSRVWLILPRGHLHQFCVAVKAKSSNSAKSIPLPQRFLISHSITGNYGKGQWIPFDKYLGFASLKCLDKSQEHVNHCEQYWNFHISYKQSIYIIISKNIRYLLRNRGAWCFFHDTYLTIEVQGIRCTNHLRDYCPFIDVNPHFTAPGCRYYFKINSWWPIVTS